MPVDPLRVKVLKDLPVRLEGSYVLYWMTAFRRPFWNLALEYAAQRARQWGRALLVLEGLRLEYPWASRRLHRFVMEGMEDNRAYFESRGISYLAYLEPRAGAGHGLVERLAQEACLVVGDDFPCFFLPRMLTRLASRMETRLEVVDSNGLLPLRAAPRVFARAVDFRRFLQGHLAEHLEHLGSQEPLQGLDLPRAALPGEVPLLWPSLGDDLRALPGPEPVAYRGGWRSGRVSLERFVTARLDRYGERSSPAAEVSSGLSPYLHFGHLSVAEVLEAVASKEGWSPARLGLSARGSKEGWWGMSPAAEGFMDELVTWRELGYNMCWQVPDYDRYESLPDWARSTLESHAEDPREYRYSLNQFDQGKTHDPLWNAAQRQLREEGRIHNYLRMLWGKKVLEWTAHPREALEILIELNNRYAVDGRNPNSYSGIFWCLGRYDRPWFERPIFGVVRYMSSESTRRKFDLKPYLTRWGS